MTRKYPSFMSSYDFLWSILEPCHGEQNYAMVYPYFFIEPSRSLHYKFQHSPLIVMKTGILQYLHNCPVNISPRDLSQKIKET